MGNEEPTSMVSVRIGELNKLCRNKESSELNKPKLGMQWQTMGIGKGTGQAKFYSPTKKRVTPKSCVMIRRSLFPTEVLEKLGRASGVEVQLREGGE
ncbi:hypothetical protein OS493_012339 [Desmophyllum pertusum]|uniref:Uncharacterized protein n=1 Tax=Desmophyllum pertusum TaxID=174260 RepID=A0A9X0D499_9CNID|nr:hypothetical protein OS493_012339 [Desmophyllum pertusum]